jgi:hypothetical protein
VRVGLALREIACFTIDLVHCITMTLRGRLRRSRFCLIIAK